MFDSIGVFQRQFTPVEGGYAYYPSRKGGAKFVSPEEYAALVARWQRVAGRRGMWTSTGVIMAIIIVWVTLSEWLTLPDWTQNVMTTACVVGLMAWIYYASFAPRRLVRGRPDILPPRPMAQMRRDARAMLNWRFILFSLGFSGLIFWGCVAGGDRSFRGWAWMLGSGGMFALYIWFGIRKLMDRAQ
ncbi:hypothetical protein N5J77_28295 [Sphingobium yanoikuyae]|uniref:Uncharacterized protein n=2 Tax=Sphingobium yanoikuyae TaxID=13690 RepID=A0AA42X267_SPHYA|nr:hypothetical protein [Sphingobium yanoikuyae]MDH2135033.1 hypothetical protein [Sphingobium yanoikuyae]MDH2153074.1 hypothetical protein [Sphingobium yanoikuyae]MDH2170415.1 hypothetical protein [Sphingobium yanoikuyae]